MKRVSVLLMLTIFFLSSCNIQFDSKKDKCEKDESLVNGVCVVEGTEQPVQNIDSVTGISIEQEEESEITQPHNFNCDLSQDLNGDGTVDRVELRICGGDLPQTDPVEPTPVVPTPVAPGPVNDIDCTVSQDLNGDGTVDRKELHICGGDLPQPAPEDEDQDDNAQYVLSDKAVLYTTVYSHNEDDVVRYGMLIDDPNISTEDEFQEYKKYRSTIVALAQMIKDENAVYNFEPDWLFLEAAKRFEIDDDKSGGKDELFALTNNKNLLRYLKEDLQVEIDPHSHENEGYNYADVAYLISLFGVDPSAVVGGFLKFAANPTQDLDWEKFREPLAGLKHPNYSWQADILWGGGKVHTDGGSQDVEEIVFSGIYRPQDLTHEMEHDSSANLIEIGTGGWGADSFSTVVDEIEADSNSNYKMYTFSLPCFELDIYDDVFGVRAETGKSLENSPKLEQCRDYIRQISAVNSTNSKVEVRWKHFTEVASIWKTTYQEVENILVISNMSHSAPGNSNPVNNFDCTVSEDLNGDGTVDQIELKLCGGDLPQTTPVDSNPINDFNCTLSQDLNGDGTVDQVELRLCSGV